MEISLAASLEVNTYLSFKMKVAGYHAILFIIFWETVKAMKKKEKVGI